jgi:ribosomal protein L29
MKANELRNLSEDDLMAKYAELQVELSRVKAAAARGAAKKEIGKIRPLRKNIARILTVLNEKGTEEENE